VSYYPDEPEHRTPGLVRRLVLAVVIALLLGGGTTLAVRYATTSHRPTAAPSPTVSATTEAPYVPLVVEPSPSLVGSASPSPGPTRPGPTPSRSVRHTPSPSPSRMPMYHVPADGLCNYIDFSPLAAVNTRDGADLDPHVVSGTTGNTTGGKAYTCKGYLGNTTIREICVEIYPDRATTLASWATEKSTDVTIDADVYPGLGDDNIGFFLNAMRYKIDVLKDNMWLFVVVDHSLPEPDIAAYKAAAAAVARSIPQKLPHAAP
jgi:hypothetical protein